MTGHRLITLRSASLVAIALAGASLIATAAGAQSRMAVDVSASGGVSTNPYQNGGSSTTVGTGTLDARPSLTITSPLTTLTLSGDANVALYTSNYGNNESFSLDGSVVHRLSARTSVNASIDYLNAIVGSYTDVRVPVGVPVVAVDPVVPTPIYVNDPALGGIGNRRQTYQGSVGVSTSLTERDRIGVNASASAARFGGLAFSDYNYYSPSASYSRALGPSFNVGVLMTVGFTNYLGTPIGDATIYQPSLTLSKLIAKAWTLDVAAGAAISTIRDASGTDFSSSTFNGSLSLCRRDERRNICLSGSRQTLPSAFQGVRTQTAVSASIGYQTGPRTNLSFTGSYSRAGDPVQRVVVGGVRSGSIDYLNAAGNLSHQFRPRLSGFVSAGISKIFDSRAPRDANFNGSVGVSYRFGAH